MFSNWLPKTLFSTLKRLNYPNYRRPVNYLKVSEFVDRFGSLETDSTNEQVTLTGRIMRIRSAGSNLHFMELSQDSRKLQLILKADNFTALLPLSQIITNLQKGDIVEAVGFPGRSNSGELSCKVQEFRVLSPCLINLPDDKIGIKNPELRASKRHLDLIANPDSYATFKQRSQIIATVRSFLHQRSFMEVETPILSDLSGGAVAKPFKTALTAHDQHRPLSLRIAPELFLKRLIIGGFDRVFELGKQFRDEGVDSTHNPEFTSCEFYGAYMDLEEIAVLVQDLFRELGRGCNNNMFDDEFKRINLIPELEQCTGGTIDASDPKSFIQPALLAHLPPEHQSLPPAKIFDKLVSTLIEPRCILPTFLFGHPTFVSPLAKAHPSSSGISDRFELFVQGREIANAYSELNDPVEQSRRFKAQGEQRAQGDTEIPEADEQFVEALRAGMPPTTGCGIGIDRLVMLLTNQKQIRNVMLFPL